jgi:two-component system sensor histidine kinase RegB
MRFIIANSGEIRYVMAMNLGQFFFPKLNLRDENLTKASWLLRFRWFVVISQSITAVVCAFLKLIPFEKFPFFLFLIISLILFNTISTIDKKNLFSQILFDIVQLFLFLYLFSFIKNPLVEIFYLHLVLAVFVLDIWSNLIIYLLIISISAYFYGRVGADHHNVHHFFSHLFTMTLIWMILNWMTSILTKFQKTFYQIQDNKNRMDRLKSIGAMSSGICHELATPLGTIKLKLNKLNRKKEYIEDDIQVAIEAIAQCESSIKKLASSVVKFEHDVESEVDLFQTSKELAKHFKKCEFEIKNNTDIKIKVNEIVLIQTLMDLIDNACFFSIDKKIYINIFEENSSVMWNIENVGPHFSKIILEKLGEPFLTVKENGNGLGLFNAYNFMMASNGSIQLFNLENGVRVNLKFAT